MLPPEHPAPRKDGTAAHQTTELGEILAALQAAVSALADQLAQIDGREEETQEMILARAATAQAAIDALSETIEARATSLAEQIAAFEVTLRTGWSRVVEEVGAAETAIVSLTGNLQRQDSAAAEIAAGLSAAAEDGKQAFAAERDGHAARVTELAPDIFDRLAAAAAAARLAMERSFATLDSEMQADASGLRDRTAGAFVPEMAHQVGKLEQHLLAAICALGQHGAAIAARFGQTRLGETAALGREVQELSRELRAACGDIRTVLGTVSAATEAASNGVQAVSIGLRASIGTLNDLHHILQDIHL
jgi:hypothetical protein